MMAQRYKHPRPTSQCKRNNLVKRPACDTLEKSLLMSPNTTRTFLLLYHVLGEALDISKAFDRVWHAGLLTKLSSIGITGQLNNWFSNYLSGRAQRVVLASEQSDLMPIKAGVPQGSVLGPILFLVYINDIADELECRVSLFADDNILYIFADTVDEFRKCIEQGPGGNGKLGLYLVGDI